MVKTVSQRSNTSVKFILGLNVESWQLQVCVDWDYHNENVYHKHVLTNSLLREVAHRT